MAPEDPRRIRILSTLAMELGESAVERGWTLALESLRAARALGRADELGLAASACLHVGIGADYLPERRAILDEALAGQLGPLTPLVTALLQVHMLTERIRFAELARFDAGSAVRGFQTMNDVTATWLQPARFALDSAVMLLTGTLPAHAAELAAPALRGAGHRGGGPGLRRRGRLPAGRPRRAPGPAA